MTTLFLSDVHLSASRPAIVTGFTSFLERGVRDADAVYILGDLFDEWLGDDDDRPPHPQVISALSGLAGSGVPVYVMRGNHDFLLGERFESMSGCSLLDDEVVVDLYGTRVLLMHGDSLCTRDTEYQEFRKMSRDPANQQAFLSRPLDVRAAQAADIRRGSRESTRLKTDEIMDVTPQAVVQTMRAYGVTHLVHGHTHRPDIHDTDLGGDVGKRIVLGDWYEQGSVLYWSAGGFSLDRLKPFSF